MKNSENLEVVLEILETIEKINTSIRIQDRQIAVMHYNGLEKRIITIQSIYPKTNILNKVLDKIYSLHVSDLYQELEADIELQKKHGVELIAKGK